MQLQLFRWLPVNHDQKHHLEKCEAICNTSQEHWQHIPLQYFYSSTIFFQASTSLSSDRHDSCIPIPQQLSPSIHRQMLSATEKLQTPLQAQTVFNIVSNMFQIFKSCWRQGILMLTTMAWTLKNSVQKNFQHKIWFIVFSLPLLHLKKILKKNLNISVNTF